VVLWFFLLRPLYENTIQYVGLNENNACSSAVMGIEFYSVCR